MIAIKKSLFCIGKNNKNKKEYFEKEINTYIFKVTVFEGSHSLPIFLQGTNSNKSLLLSF